MKFENVILSSTFHGLFWQATSKTIWKTETMSRSTENKRLLALGVTDDQIGWNYYYYDDDDDCHHHYYYY